VTDTVSVHQQGDQLLSGLFTLDVLGHSVMVPLNSSESSMQTLLHAQLEVERNGKIILIDRLTRDNGDIDDPYYHAWKIVFPISMGLVPEMALSLPSILPANPNITLSSIEHVNEGAYIPPSGYFMLDIDGIETQPIALNASATEITARLLEIPTISYIEVK
jgi:hypothetical protein